MHDSNITQVDNIILVIFCFGKRNENLIQFSFQLKVRRIC